MEHFVRIVMEKQDELVEGLDKSVFPESYVLESEQGATVFYSTSKRTKRTRS